MPNAEMPTQAQVEADIKHSIRDSEDAQLKTDQNLYSKINAMEFELRQALSDLSQIKSSLGSFADRQSNADVLLDAKWQTELSKSEISAKEKMIAIDTELKGLRKDAVTNWPLIGTIGTIAVAIIGFIVNSMVQPLNARIDSIGTSSKSQAEEISNLRDFTTRSTGADAVSVVDRAALNVKVNDNNKLIGEINTRLGAQQADFLSRTTEVETQIDSIAQSLAVQFSSIARTENGMSQAINGLGGKYPIPLTDPYSFPNISNRAPMKSGAIQ